MIHYMWWKSFKHKVTILRLQKKENYVCKKRELRSWTENEVYKTRTT